MKTSWIYLFLGLMFVLVIPSAEASSWYLGTSQGLSDDWNTLTDWWSAPNGTGTHPTAIIATDTFYTNGFTLRAPQSTTNAIFGGTTLVMNGGEVLEKSKGPVGTITGIANLVSVGGVSRLVDNGANNGLAQTVNITTLTTAASEGTTFGTGGTARGINLTIGTLVGNGDLTINGAGAASLTVTSSPNFYGSLYVAGTTTLTLQSNLVSKGALYVEDGSQIVLNHNLTVSSAVIGGAISWPTNLWAGGVTLTPNTTYTAAALQAAYPSVFTGGSGSITVTQPNVAADVATVLGNVGEGQLGACIGAGNFWTSLTPNYRTDMQQVHLGMVRTNVTPSKGFTLDQMDHRVAQILNTGAVPLFIQGIDTVAHNPTFMSGLYDVNGNLGTGGTPATNMAFLVNRYKSAPYNLTTQYWEVGNEPDIATDYQVASPQEYVDFYQSCHNQLVTSGLRNNVILCGPVVAFEYGFAANSNKTDNILNAFFTACAAPLNGFNQVDVVTRHVYANIYSWETSPSTPDSAYNLLNANCEQVTFTQTAVPALSYRGEYAIQAKLNSLGYPSTVGTGVTEMNVPTEYKDTITQGLWFLTYDHFGIYNPRNVMSAGYVWDLVGGNGYYNSDKSHGYPYWANYIHGLLTGNQILAQNSSDPHLLVTATKDASYVYLQVLNRNTSDITATVALNNAPVSGSPTVYQLSATATPDAGAATSLGTSFSYTFPAMSTQVFRYLRTDAPAPVVPPAPPSTVVADINFATTPTGMQTYYTGYQPVVSGGNLILTNTLANEVSAAVFDGQALAYSQNRVQIRFGFNFSGKDADGVVFGAYSADPGTVGVEGQGLGYYGQTHQLWGVKLDSQPDEIDVLSGNVNSTVDGFVSQPLALYYGMEMYMVIDYDGTAGTVRARLYQGTSDSGVLVADLTNRIGNPSALPAGTVFGLTGSNNKFVSTSTIHNITVLGDPAGTGLPSPWLNQDVGSTSPAGGASYAAGTFTLNTGNGTEFYGTTADAFQYVYQPISGDHTITARVASLNSSDAIKAESGVMIRETLTSNSTYALMGVTSGRGLQFQYRTTTGAVSSNVGGASGVAPYWVRLVRAGNTFTAYQSSNNTTWTQVGTSQTIAMTTAAYIGLPFCQHGTGTGTATVDNVTVTSP